LVGVSILDTGLQIINMYGSPDEVQPLTVGGGGVGPGGGAGAGSGGRGGVGGPSGGAGPQMAPGGLWNPPTVGMLGDPFGQQAGAAERPPGVDANGFGPPGNAGGNAGGNAAGGGPGGQGGDNRILFTRWVYKQGASRYAFVLDKFNRAVQIEAVGMSDSKVRTSRGIKFGSTFADVIKAYNAPDAYEITGDTIVVRYLVRDHVAFRLAKLKAKDTHRVTGIVVAAGKS
jgi:hypothetical protein